MAILDVGMLSGFTISPGATTPTDLIPKTETLSDKVILYFHTVSISCRMILQLNSVAQIQDAVVRVYDYYEPSEYAQTETSVQTLNINKLPFSYCKCLKQ
uniref:Alpha-macroglobulin receptor-binding domain-containing protein n=1 Tax=Periophthalmus magnuspinnatus TaxID=409849 RepID=A0A3B4A9L4_9GOBI